MKKIACLLIYLMNTYVFAQKISDNQSSNNGLCINQPFFIENKGQWSEEILFLANLHGVDFWITRDGMTFDYYETKTQINSSSYQAGKSFPEAICQQGHVIKTRFVNCNVNSISEGQNKRPGYYNYFIGDDTSRYASFVGLYDEVIVRNIYNGIDLRYYFDEGFPRFDFIVYPYADPSVIQLEFSGQEMIYAERNNIHLFTPAGKIVLTDLKAYQSHNIITSSFVQKDERFYFSMGNYDPSYTLTIDPLIYSTLFGGSEDDRGQSMIFDKTGNIVITGFTRSKNFPIKGGAYDESFNDNMDVFVTKWDQTGNVIYSTFLGGKSRDKGLSIALDNNDNIYITGLTTSSDFPVTPNGYDQSYNGFDDIFVSILNNTGSSLIYSTFIGGSDWDNAYSLVIDEKLNMFLTGGTSSKDFPTTQGAYDQSHNGDNDAFVIKLNTSSLAFSTYLGGSGGDDGSAIAVDKSGNVYVTGNTKGNFPTTSGTFDETHNGNDDVFITKMNASGTSVIYSTYLGGGNTEEVLSLRVDKDGNVYVTGSTSSPDFPAKKGSFDITFNEGVSDAFVCKLDPTGSNLVYSTFLGGNKEDAGISLTIDAAGNAYVTGYTSSDNFPVTKKVLDKTYNGKFDGFIVKLNPPGNSLAYSTFFGGDGNEVGDQITIDEQGIIYVTGYTESSDFPVSTNAYSKTHQGKKDAYILKMSTKKK